MSINCMDLWKCGHITDLYKIEKKSYIVAKTVHNSFFTELFKMINFFYLCPKAL